MFLDSTHSASDCHTAELFSRLFSSIHTNSDYGTMHLLHLLGVSVYISDWLCTPNEVLEVIFGSDRGSSCVPDSLPMIILKKCASLFAPLPAKLFNICLMYAFYPTIWKVAYITPIYKSGETSNIRNYRRISIISPCAMIFDYLIS